jgi:hypothetical protein
LQLHQNPQNIFIYSISLFPIIYFLLFYFILFVYLFRNFVLDNHLVKLEMQDQEIVLQVAWWEQRELFRLFPESLIFTLSHPYGKKLLMLQHSALGVPTKWHIA